MQPSLTQSQTTYRLLLETAQHSINPASSPHFRPAETSLSPQLQCYMNLILNNHFFGVGIGECLFELFCEAEAFMKLRST